MILARNTSIKINIDLRHINTFEKKLLVLTGSFHTLHKASRP